jgi:hypothetical protein
VEVYHQNSICLMLVGSRDGIFGIFLCGSEIVRVSV